MSPLHLAGEAQIEGTQRLIRVNGYSCSSSSLLATFPEQNNDFFSNDYMNSLYYSRIMFMNISTKADVSKFSVCKRICERIT